MQVTDPVCKMVIEDTDAAGTSVYKGTTYYFCTGRCKEDFDKNPESFIKRDIPAGMNQSKTSPFSVIKHPIKSSGKIEEEDGATKDPVCGMSVYPDKAAFKYEYQGKMYFFCCLSCLNKFQKEPEKYLSQQGRITAMPVSTSQICTGYTCPMHPEVKEEHSGSCPQCGMALEPMTPLLSTKTEWICPMDPEVVSDKPGSCPKCGMALEPRIISLDAEENPELIDMKRRFRISLALQFQ
jgi:YHS domain-containing protein